MKLKKIPKAGKSSAQIRASTSALKNVLVEKVREMPPEQALQLILIFGVGVGQFASSLRGEPDHYAKLYAQCVGDVIDGVSKPLFTNVAIPINAIFGGMSNVLENVPTDLSIGVDVPGLPKIPKDVIPNWVPGIGRF